MKPDFSRRDFLTAGLALPAAGFRAAGNPPLLPEGKRGWARSRQADLPHAGQDRPEGHVARVRLHDDFGPDRDQARGGPGDQPLRHRPRLSERQQRANGRRRSEGRPSEGDPLEQERGQDQGGAPRRPGHEPAGAGDRLPRHLVPPQPERAGRGDGGPARGAAVAKQGGKIRFAGVSTHFNMDKILAHQAKLGQTDVVLTTYNFAMRSVDAARTRTPTRRRPT